MGRKGNIEWGISNYFGLPNRKKKLLTKEFLTDFRDEMIRLIDKEDEMHGTPTNWKRDGSYYGVFGQIEGTYVYGKALETTCIKYNVVNAICGWLQKLPWYDSDVAENSIMLEMVNKGVIPKETGHEYEGCWDNEKQFFINYKIVKRYKDYNVINYDKCLKENKEWLEELYEDSDEEIIWLD